MQSSRNWPLLAIIFLNVDFLSISILKLLYLHMQYAINKKTLKLMFSKADQMTCIAYTFKKLPFSHVTPNSDHLRHYPSSVTLTVEL